MATIVQMMSGVASDNRIRTRRAAFRALKHDQSVQSLKQLAEKLGGDVTDHILYNIQRGVSHASIELIDQLRRLSRVDEQLLESLLDPDSQPDGDVGLAEHLEEFQRSYVGKSLLETADDFRTGVEALLRALRRDDVYLLVTMDQFPFELRREEEDLAGRLVGSVQAGAHFVYVVPAKDSPAHNLVKSLGLNASVSDLASDESFNAFRTKAQVPDGGTVTCLPLASCPYFVPHCKFALFVGASLPNRWAATMNFPCNAEAKLQFTPHVPLSSEFAATMALFFRHVDSEPSRSLVSNEDAAKVVAEQLRKVLSGPPQ